MEETVVGASDLSDAVRGRIARQMPALAFRSVEPLGEGESCRAYAVDGEWVLRIARHEAAAEGLRREACLLPRLAERLPLPIPRPVLVESAGNDPPLAVHRMLPGPSLTRSRYLGVPEAARDRCARQVGDFLAVLHGTDLAEARGCGVPAMDAEHRYAVARDEIRRELIPRLPVPERHFASRILGERLASESPPPFEPVLLHGDIDPTHVMLDEAAISVGGIIDFGDVCIGDPAWDLMYITDDYGLDFLGRMLRAYPTPDRRRLLDRMQRFLELEALVWALQCSRVDDAEPFEEAVVYLRDLRRRSHPPAWHALIPDDRSIHAHQDRG